VITHAEFHPTEPDLLAFSTSRSVLSVIDLREKDVTGSNALELGRDHQPVRTALSSVITIVHHVHAGPLCTLPAQEV
jgi:hypothetical protein